MKNEQHLFLNLNIKLTVKFIHVNNIQTFGFFRASEWHPLSFHGNQRSLGTPRLGETFPRTISETFSGTRLFIMPISIDPLPSPFYQLILYVCIAEEYTYKGTGYSCSFLAQKLAII